MWQNSTIFDNSIIFVPSVDGWAVACYNKRMQAFIITLQNVLLMFLYAVPGFLLCKTKKVTAEHLPLLSSVLVYICTPALLCSAFMDLEFSWELFGQMGLFFVASFLGQLAFMLLVLFFTRKKSSAKTRMVSVGSVLGNVGFFGLPVITALFPENPEVACYSAMYVVSMNILVFTAGVYGLTGDKQYVSLKKALLNPTTLGLLAALPFFFFGLKAYLPEVFTGGISLVGKMSAPLCMVVLGVRLATVPFKQLITRPEVYLTCAFKLLVFPLFCYACVYFLPVAQTFKASLLILSAAPAAAVLLSLAEIHHTQQDTAADIVLLSVILCVVTLPVLSLLI